MGTSLRRASAGSGARREPLEDVTRGVACEPARGVGESARGSLAELLEHEERAAVRIRDGDGPWRTSGKRLGDPLIPGGRPACIEHEQAARGAPAASTTRLRPPAEPEPEPRPLHRHPADLSAPSPRHGHGRHGHWGTTGRRTRGSRTSYAPDSRRSKASSGRATASGKSRRAAAQADVDDRPGARRTEARPEHRPRAASVPRHGMRSTSGPGSRRGARSQRSSRASRVKAQSAGRTTTYRFGSTPAALGEDVTAILEPDVDDLALRRCHRLELGGLSGRGDALRLSGRQGTRPRSGAGPR